MNSEIDLTRVLLSDNTVIVAVFRNFLRASPVAVSSNFPNHPAAAVDSRHFRELFLALVLVCGEMLI